MRKMLFCLFFSFITFVLFNLNVSALTTYDFTNAYEYNNTLDYQWYNRRYLHETVPQDVIDRIIDIMNNRGNYYVISFINSSTAYEYFIGIRIYEYSSIPYLYLDEVNSDNVIFRSSVSSTRYDISFFRSTLNKNGPIESVNSAIDELENGTLTSSYTGTMLIWWWTAIESDYTYTNNREVIYYSNFDLIYRDSNNENNIKIGDEIISHGDEFITLYDYLNPNDNIDLTLKETFETNSIDEYTLSFGISKLLIETQNKYNFKIETTLTGNNNDELPGTPIFKLYKKQNDDFVLVENDSYIVYDWIESSNDSNYYLDGYIEFSNEVSYVNDYILEISFSNIDYSVINVYDDSTICSWTGEYNFLKDYIEYTFKAGSSGYAISYNNDFKGKIYVESKYINDPYNFGAGYYHYATKTRGSELEFYEFLTGEYSYVDFTIEYFNNKQDENHVLVVFKNIENDEDIVFYVPKELTVSEITVSNVNDDGTVDFEFIMNTPNGEGTFNEEFNYNFGDEEFINTFTGAINFFITPIKEIFKMIATFYNNLTVPLKMFFISLFGLGISVFIVRFLL